MIARRSLSASQQAGFRRTMNSPGDRALVPPRSRSRQLLTAGKRPSGTLAHRPTVDPSLCHRASASWRASGSTKPLNPRGIAVHQPSNRPGHWPGNESANGLSVRIQAKGKPVNPSAPPIDLRRSEVFYAMLLDPWPWRQRCVERLTLGHAHHVEVSNRYQILLESEALPVEEGTAPDSAVRLLVPLSTRPKQPLFGFDLHGPEGHPISLLTRREIAALQQGLISYMLAPSKLSVRLATDWPEALLDSIFRFIPDLFHHTEQDVARGHRLTHKRRLLAYQRFLLSQSGIRLSTEEVAECMDMQNSIAERLALALGEAPCWYSSAEQPLLAIPSMSSDQRPTDGEGVLSLLRGYMEGIALADQEGLDSILAVLAEYGRRWQVVVDTVVSLDQRHSVGTTEYRPFESVEQSPTSVQMVRRVAGAFRQQEVKHRIELLDAPSVHCEVRSSDHRVEVGRYTIEAPDGEKLAFPFWEGVRHTPEFLSFYTSEAQGPAWGTLIVGLRPVAHVRWPTRFILFLTVSAVIVAASVEFRQPAQLLSMFALLSFPTTFAVTLLLLREGSGLSARLQVPVRLGLTALTAVLWVVVLVRTAGLASMG